MKVIQTPRGGGKSVEILARMAHDPRTVAVSVNQAHAEALFRMATARKLDLARHRFMSLDNVRAGARGFYQDTVYLVDNADLALSYLLNLRGLESIGAISITDEDASPIVRRFTVDGDQIVVVNRRYAYIWDEPHNPLNIGDKVVLPPGPGFNSRWEGRVTSLGSNYPGPLKSILAKVPR